MKILIFTKTRHIEKIHRNLPAITNEYVIYTISNEALAYENELEFDLGISYGYGRLIKEPLLSRPRLGFVNFHPAPLPEYKGGDPYSDAIKDKVMEWGVSAHYMNENYDEGEIIQVNRFSLFEPPQTREELGAIAHYYNFKLFLELLPKLLIIKVNSV